MAEVHGKGGNFTFTGITAGMKEWRLTTDVDLVEITDYADSGQKKYIAGCKDWTADVTANWEVANTAREGDTGTLSLKVAGTTGYSGSAILRSMSIPHSQGDAVVVTYSFQGNGALS